MPIVLVKPQKRRKRPWHRWSKWIVTTPPPWSSAPIREAESNRHMFKWWADLVSAGAKPFLTPDRLGITQHFETRRTIKRAKP